MSEATSTPDPSTASDAVARPPRHRLRKALLWIAGIAVALFAVLQFALGSIVRQAAAVAGPVFLGTPVSISNVHARILSGRVAIDGMVVGPPEGFDANVFELSSFRLDLDMGSLLRSSRPIHIREIVIAGPIVTYEIKGLGNINIKAILDRLAKAEEEEKEDKEKKPGRKVVIDSFVFEDAKVRVAVYDGKGAVVPLPRIPLADIGAKSGGATGIEALGQILRSIGKGTAEAAVSAVGDVAGLAADLVKGVGGAAANVVEGVGGAAIDVVKGIGGLLSGDKDPAGTDPAEGGK